MAGEVMFPRVLEACNDKISSLDSLVSYYRGEIEKKEKAIAEKDELIKTYTDRLKALSSRVETLEAEKRGLSRAEYDKAVDAHEEV